MNPIEEIRYLILAAQREGSRTFTELLKPLGLTTSQSEVLRVLYDHEPLSLIEVGQLLVCETGSPSRLVSRMVEAGLIEQRRSPVDSRKVQLSLTEKGRDSAIKIKDMEERFYGTLTPMLEGKPVKDLIELLWTQVKGKPTGNALTLRKDKQEAKEQCLRP